MKLLNDFSPAEFAELEKNLRPRGLSDEGFLSKTDDLRKIIETDARVITLLGITHKQIGDRIESIMGQALRQWDLLFDAGVKDGKRQGILIGDLRIYAVEYRGHQICPFCAEGGDACHDFTIINEKNGHVIKFPQLIAHLIREHHFFEGHTKYRLDPQEAIRTLDIKPGIDYTPKIAIELVWEQVCSTESIDDPRCTLNAIAYKRIKITPLIEARVSEDSLLLISREYEWHKFPDGLKIDGLKVELFASKILQRGKELYKKSPRRYIIG